VVFYVILREKKYFRFFGNGKEFLGEICSGSFSEYFYKRISTNRSPLIVIKNA